MPPSRPLYRLPARTASWENRAARARDRTRFRSSPARPAFGGLMLQRIVLTIGLLTLLLCNGAGDGAKPRQQQDGWRSLPLITGAKIDPAWFHTGYGGFVVDDGALRTECDARGLGLLVYGKEAFGDCQIRVVYRSEKPSS